MTAIVCNCKSTGLSVIQELGRQGIEVYALDNFRNLGTVSKHSEYKRSPNPTIDESGFINYLVDLGRGFENKPVIIPTSDHWAAALAKNKAELGNLYNLCVADWDVVDRLLNKNKFSEWAEERGYPVPKKWNTENYERIPDEAFPIACKPSDARYRPDVFNSKVARIVERVRNPLENTGVEDVDNTYDEFDRFVVAENRAQLEELLSEVDPQKVSLQEYVRGDSSQMRTVGIYANKNNKIIGQFTGEKVRGYPPDAGDCKLGKPTPIPDEIIEVVHEICNDLSYTGIAEFEFKIDSETGEYRLIEINPRTWSWTGITPSCGVNLPLLAYRDLSPTHTSPEVRVENSGNEDVVWVRPFEDLMNSICFNKKSNKYDWSYSPKEWYNQIAKSEKTVYADFSKQDLKPSAYAVLLSVRKAFLQLMD